MSEDVKKYPLWKQAVEDLLALAPAPGFVLEEQWLLEHLELVAPDYGSLETFKGWNLRYLQARSAFFETLRDIHALQFAQKADGGWRLLAPGEVSKAALGRMKHELYKELRRARTSLACADRTKMSEAELMENAEALTRVARAMSLAREAVKLPPPATVPKRIQ